MPNTLYFGDNIDWLSDRERFPTGSVNLIYLDPPFNSKVAYNILYQSPDGVSASAQYKAFVDSWRWGPAADYAFSLVMASGSQAAGIMSSFQNYMQKSDLMAYLTMMAARLLELHRILSPAGSLYLHCDSTASHYLKIVLDSIFGPAAFRNEIVWKRSHAHNDGKQGAKHFGRITDSLLFYTKSQSYTWNRLFRPYDKKYIDRDYRRIDEDRRRYRIDNMRGPGGAEKGNPFYEVMGVSRYWAYSEENMEQFIREGRVIQTRPGAVPQLKRYLDEMPGMPIQNLWDDLPVLNNRSREVLGYPTQKPLALLERIISASSNPGDVVLDPFCGCGTAIEAAQALNRKWIGIDITALALDVVERRLLRTFRTLRREADYFVEGIPLDLDGAKRLFDQDAHEFQLWALTLVDGQPREGGKRGPDGGVDGLIYFQDTADTIGHAIVSVKGGFNRSVKDVRDLIGTMNNQRAKMGVLVTLHEPTPQMERTAHEAESIEAGGRVRARVQIRTIQQLFQHNKPDLPPIFDVISAAAAARRMRRSPSRPPTPEELRREPELPPMPIAGGRGTHRQEPLPLEEPLLSTPQPSQRRRRSRS